MCRTDYSASLAQALEVQMPLFSASLMGVITAVLGGVLRDMICNEIPTVFRDRRPENRLRK